MVVKGTLQWNDIGTGYWELLTEDKKYSLYIEPQYADAWVQGAEAELEVEPLGEMQSLYMQKNTPAVVKRVLGLKLPN